jgi:hypothetical protein
MGRGEAPREAGAAAGAETDLETVSATGAETGAETGAMAEEAAALALLTHLRARMRQALVGANVDAPRMADDALRIALLARRLRLERVSRAAMRLVDAASAGGVSAPHLRMLALDLDRAGAATR